MKAKRQNKILELIETYNIDTQEEIARLLKEAGFKVTQATVSRDIRELKLTKISAGNGKQKYSVIAENDTEFSDKLIRVFREVVTSIDFAQNIIVIKTLEGMGMAVAVALDSMKNHEIVGTIAGDDTVFCLVRTHTQTVGIIDRLNKIIKEQ